MYEEENKQLTKICSKYVFNILDSLSYFMNIKDLSYKTCTLNLLKTKNTNYSLLYQI